MRGFEPYVAQQFAQKNKRAGYANGGLVAPSQRAMPQLNQEPSNPFQQAIDDKADAMSALGVTEKSRESWSVAAPTDWSGGVSFKDGGPVRGPGTGTSDSVKDRVPEGTYIMPTDSTQAIGEQQLGAMGAKNIPVAVNLSNGEFKLPPEQVHAVGVQALDQMKNATHTPVAARGFTPGALQAQQPVEPPMFFADGGVVDESARKVAPYVNHRPPNGPPAMPAQPLLGSSVPPSTGVTNTHRPNFTMGGGGDVPPVRPEATDVRPKYNPANGSPEAKAWQAQRAGTTAPAPAAAPAPAPAGAPAPAPQGAGYRAGAALGRAAAPLLKAAGSVAMPAVLASTAGTVGDTPTSDYETRFGFSPNTTEGVRGLARDVGVRALGAASDVGDALTFGLAGKHLYADKQANATSAGSTAGAASSGAQPRGLPGYVEADGRFNGPPASAAGQMTNIGGGIERIDRPGHSPLYTDNKDPMMAGFMNRAAGGPTKEVSSIMQRMSDQSDAQRANRFQAQDNAAQFARESQQARGFNAAGAENARNVQNRMDQEKYLRQMDVRAAGATHAGERLVNLKAYNEATKADAAVRQGSDAGSVARTQADASRYGYDTNAAVSRYSSDQESARSSARTALDGRRVAADEGRYALDATARGFDIRQAERMEGMQNKYLAAIGVGDEKTAGTLEKQIRGFTGKSGEDKWGFHFSPNVKNVDGSTTEGGMFRTNPRTGQAERVDAGQGGKGNSSEFEKGSVYVDAQGRRARYTGTGWEPA